MMGLTGRGGGNLEKMKAAERAWIGVGCVALLMHASPCLAQTESALREWLALESAPNRVWEVAKNTHWVYEATHPARMSAEELRRLGEEIAGKPEHPDRGRYKDESRRLATGGDVERVELWVGDAENWRLNRTSLFGPGQIFDVARRRDVAWSSSGRQLAVVATDEPPPPNRDLASQSNDVMFAVSLFSSAALSMTSDPSVKLEEAKLTGNRWRASFVGGEYTRRFEGTWDVTAGRFIVTSSEVLSQGKVVEGSSESYGGHKELDALAAYTLVSGSGPPLRGSRRLISCQSVSAAEIDRVTAVPPLKGPDAVRGPTSIESVHDYRPNGSFEEVSEPGTPSVRRMVPDASRTRWMGWIAGGLVVAVLGVGRWKYGKKES